VRILLKCYLDFFWHYKNQILRILLSGNIIDNLIVKQLFLAEFFGDLILQLRGLTLIGQLSVWMAPIYLQGLGEKLFIVVDFDTDNRTLPLVYALVEEENNINWRWFL